ELDVEDIRDRIYTPQADLPEGVSRIHLKTIHLNKSPFVAPLSVLKDVDLERIGLDYAICKKHLALIKDNLSLDKKVATIFDQAYDQSNDDVDEMIYAGFFSSQDRYQLDQIRKKAAEAIPFDSTTFKDKRAAELINRYKARNFPDLLSPEQNQSWLNAAQMRLEKKHGDDFSDWFEHLNQLREQADISDQKLLDKTEQFVMEKSFSCRYSFFALIIKYLVMT
ncbi:MAG: hypothetical protein L3J52_06955, partial [Proteobacteria bacterium]|nr:hypothetical protein [Pseudomonadota bacterium]